MKTRVFLKCFVHDCLLETTFASNSPQTPLKMISLTVLGTLRTLIQFSLKLEQLICKKVLKLVLLDNYFSDLFTEVQI